tara:strand:- start:1619 stop:2581 length:963 start_codon:yes stop_codon:yes gene_type:complete
MKRIALIILIIFSKSTLGHVDFCKSFTDKNVTSRIMTGYQFEIIKQAELISKLASKLSSDLGYKKPVFIDFAHDYIYENSACRYAIGFNKVFQCGDDLENKMIHGEQLYSDQVATISIVGVKYEMQEILMLLQALIQNQPSTTKAIDCDSQSIVHHWQGHQSIDQNSIEKIIRQKASDEVRAVMSDSIFLASFKKGRLAYYWQNKHFILVEKKWSYSKDSMVIRSIDTLSNILQFEEIGNAYFIFEDDSTFKFICPNGDYISGTLKLEKHSERYFRPYKIHEISSHSYSINTGDRVSLFIFNMHEKSSRLILDLYEKIKD